jgi:MFS family permease
MVHTARFGKLSKVGGWVSILCAIHCMISPIVLGLIPVIHARSPVAEHIETLLIVLSVIISSITVAMGFREHRRASIVALLAVSFACLAAARFVASASMETPLVIAGAVIMAVAQFLNIRYQRSCCRHHPDKSRNEFSSIANRV